MFIPSSLLISQKNLDTNTQANQHSFHFYYFKFFTATTKHKQTRYLFVPKKVYGPCTFGWPVLYKTIRLASIPFRSCLPLHLPHVPSFGSRTFIIAPHSLNRMVCFCPLARCSQFLSDFETQGFGNVLIMYWLRNWELEYVNFNVIIILFYVILIDRCGHNVIKLKRGS